MQILGFHIISDAELRRQIEDAQLIQRNLNKRLIARLLHNAEHYRRMADAAVKMIHGSSRQKFLNKHRK